MRRAYLFSAREHKGQKRASGEAYLVHSARRSRTFSRTCAWTRFRSLPACFHDVVEDTLADPKTIREYFGEEVAHLVEGLTKIAHYQQRLA
jgi:GTP pyrophosphokinase